MVQDLLQSGDPGQDQAQDNADKAERLFTSALKKQGENIELYRACIKFYIRSDQKEKIPELLDEADSSISDTLPEFQTLCVLFIA